MRAFVIHQFGERGAVEDIPVPELGEGQVLVRVRSSSVNGVDPVCRTGMYKDYVEHRMPFVFGMDLAGTVEAVAPGADGFAVGDEVYGTVGKPHWGEGSWAEFVAVPTTALARRPASLPSESAGALALAGTMALVLTETVEAGPDKTVAIVGAGGGVGSFATQLAARAGARVVAVTRGEYGDHIRQLGAHEVIDYTSVDVPQELSRLHPEGVDSLIDLASDQAGVLRMAEAMKPGGRIASPVNGCDETALAARGLTGVNSFAAVNRVGEVGELVARGEIKVPISETYPLDRAADALDVQQSRHSKGKIAIAVA